jgi:hypothetical protein
VAKLSKIEGGHRNGEAGENGVNGGKQAATSAKER